MLVRVDKAGHQVPARQVEHLARSRRRLAGRTRGRDPIARDEQPSRTWLAVSSGPDGRAGRQGAVHRCPMGRDAGWLFVGDEVGDPFGLVDLDVVPSAVEQVQLAVGEQRGEVPGDLRVEVAVAGTEDHLDGPAEAAHVADAPPVLERRREQVVVEAPERRAGRDCWS